VTISDIRRRSYPLACAFLFALFSPHWIFAQEAGRKPDAPRPTVDQVAIPLPTKSQAMSLPAISSLDPDTLRELQKLATQISDAAFPSCRRTACAILVTDFTLPDGNTSEFGIRLADELSKGLANRRDKLRVVDRGLFHSALMNARGPLKSLDERAACSIAHELNATFVVLGTTTKTEDDVVKLSARLLDADNVADKDWSGTGAAINLHAPESVADLSPLEPFSFLPPLTTSASGEKVYRPEIDGVSKPDCHYMPNPPYSEGARKSKVNGAITVEAVINSKGKMEQERIIKGLPGGLNETTIATMDTWQCSPALKDGKPVPVLVKLDVNFQLY